MANVSNLRPAAGSDSGHARLSLLDRPTPSRRGRYLAGAGLLLLALMIAVALVLMSARASLSSDANALAKVGLPLGGGKIERVSVVTGPHARPIPVVVSGDQIWPRGVIAVHQLISIDVVVKRPGWISWLAGSKQHLRLTLMTPSASLREHYMTLATGAPLRLRFKEPIRVISYGQPGALRRDVLASPQTEITLPRPADAGSIAVAAAPRAWETSPASFVSWFPAGAAASAVATPAPGTLILPDTPITLTFSKPVSAALGSALPPVSPVTPGSWRTLNAHTIQFRPESYGYGLGATVQIPLPNGVQLIGGQKVGSSTGGTWSVPGGSTTRLQQLLALLGYLPLRFHYRGPGVQATPTAQEAAAIKPPRGQFSWRYGNVPDSLHSMWSPGTLGTMTQGALMAFENDQGMTTDGVAGPAVWKALINATVAGKRSTFGYSYVNVSLGGQSLTLWHDGHTLVTTPVNTGIASRPTAAGTYPVYEHIRVGTMSGTNPDGSHYDDPGIEFISYFNGGDALHAFTRAQFGFPQSLGCVEMELGPAGQVWPYTPIGTLVHVA